jgi:hypothetical protein
MQQPLDGYSATVRIVANGETISPPIRHVQLSHFILENCKHNLRHNEQVIAHFNFALDGKVTCLRFRAQIKLDSLHGIGLVFERDSILRQVSRRLIKASSYDNPCQFLATQSVLPGVRIA